MKKLSHFLCPSSGRRYPVDTPPMHGLVPVYDVTHDPPAPKADDKPVETSPQRLTQRETRALPASVQQWLAETKR